MKVLIATDGSDFSRNAVEKYCRFIHPGDHIDIKIISLVERIRPMAAEPFAVSEDYYLDVERDLGKQAEKIVSETKELILGKCGDQDISIEAEVLTGNVKRIIIDEAKSFKGDLILMGSHGYGFFRADAARVGFRFCGSSCAMFGDGRQIRRR